MMEEILVALWDLLKLLTGGNQQLLLHPFRAFLIFL